MTYADYLSVRILALMKERNLSVNEVAKAAGLLHSTVNNIVNRKTNNPKITTVHSIALAFDMKISEFLDYKLLDDMTLKDLEPLKPKKNSKEVPAE